MKSSSMALEGSMKQFGWLIVLFFSFNGYSYLGEDFSSGDQCDAGSIEIRILDAVGNINELIQHTENDLVHCLSHSAQNNELINVFKKASDCIEQKLQNVADQICQTKEDLYMRFQKYEGDQKSKERIQLGINLIKDLYLDHRQVLLDRSNYWQKMADENSRNLLLVGEFTGYAEFFRSKAKISCPDNE